MSRKRLKKYNAGGATMGMNPLQAGLGQFGAAAGNFIQQEDMRDGNLSVGGALGSGALKGASMGAALGPLGAAAGAAIGGAIGYMNRFDINAQMEAEREAKRVAQEQRQFELEQQEKAATDAILENYPVKGVAQPRFGKGGDTDPKKKKNTIWDAPLNAKRLAMHDKVLPALTKLNEEEITLMIDKSIEMDNMFKGLTGKEKLAAFKEMDMSWIKPLREKTGLSKSEIIDAAGESGALQQWAVGPVKLASMFMDFKYGGPTGPEAVANPKLAPSNLSTSQQLYGFEDGPVTMRPDMLLNAAAGVKGAQAVYNAGKLTLGQLLQKGVTAQQLRRRAMGEVLGKEVGMQGAETALTGFGMGGSTIPQYRAEGGEMIQHQANDVPKTDNNGNLNRMTATEAEITGDKHSAKSGGVGMSDEKGARIYSDQLTVDNELVAKLMKL
jgi:DNA-binding transcriptional regulator YiaG